MTKMFVRESFKDGDTTEQDTIYRCGWCGYPVAADGSALPGINDPDDATDYLKAHRDATVVQVDGYCCPDRSQMLEYQA